MSLAVVSLFVAGCTAQPEPATPALWEVTAPDGNKGWLFGTVHSLERPADWRSAKIDSALENAGIIMVEVADLEDQNGLAETFLNLGTSNGHPPLAARISPALQADLKKVLDNTGLDDMQFASTETWAAALMIAQAETASLNSEYGIDRAVIKAAKGKPVVELEGARGQLALFDALPQREQRDLLEAIVRDAASPDGESASLAAAWREGNMALIAQETQKGLLADAELREVLFTGRNKRWSVRIQQAITSGKRPFIAVGAAHMAGPDGLPAMLQGQGFAAVRVQ